MEKLARDCMTSDLACCRPHTMLDQVAKMMVQCDCGEIPVLDITDRPIGVVTDRRLTTRAVNSTRFDSGRPSNTLNDFSFL
jgi:predicted transcriptional regulator